KDPWSAKEGAGKEDWARKVSAGDMEARLASLEKQGAALLDEINKSRAADTDSDYRKVQSYPVKDKLGWQKWGEGNYATRGRIFHIEKNLLSAVDPDTKMNLWVTKLPFNDPNIQVTEKVINVTDGRSVLVIDAATGKMLVGSGDIKDPRKHPKLWKKNELPRVSAPTSQRPSLEDLKAEKLKLL